MHSFISVIYHAFQEAIAPALAGAAAGAVLLALLSVKRRREGTAVSLLQGAAIVLLFCYLGGLAAVTVLHRTIGAAWVQTHLFRAFWEAWNAFTLQIWLNPLLNIGMFMPMGVLLPLAAQPFRRWYWTLAAGAGSSLVIETLQYILQRGAADVDDLFCNTLGAMLGWCLCMIVVGLVKKQWMQAAACAVLPALAVCGAAGVFLAYQLQPYGNLADAPAFAADTRGTKWVLECELSDEPGPAGVYWAEPFTKESCDEFAFAFARRLGVDVEDHYFDTDYYDNTAFYSNHWTFTLWVDYNDRSYRYNTSSEGFSFDDAGTATEEELRDALNALGIEVPETAQFFDLGRSAYAFRADRIEGDGTLTDGELECWVKKDGTLYQVDNALTVSTLHGDAAVISETEAYNRLCAGRFSAVEAFEFFAPKEVHVTSCELQYLADSKGFRQPVYQFNLKELGGTVFVPALAG